MNIVKKKGKEINSDDKNLLLIAKYETLYSLGKIDSIAHNVGVMDRSICEFKRGESLFLFSDNGYYLISDYE